MTGLEQAMQITPSSGLAPDEIERLIIEAETSVERDREERELIIEAQPSRNLIRNARKAMAEVGKVVPGSKSSRRSTAVLTKAEESLARPTDNEIEVVLISKVEEAASRITAAMLTTA